MKLKTIYESVIRCGREGDPRSKDFIGQVLSRERERFERLDKEGKEFFDKERLGNPYADTRIMAGDPELEVKGIFVGIDIEVGEVLLADRLRERGKRIDLLLTHHPEGAGLIHLHEVMDLQVDFYARFGVSLRQAEALTQERQQEVSRRILPLNHYRNVDAARSLDFAFMSVHTPSDNRVFHYLQGIYDREKPPDVKGVMEILKGIPEYQIAARDQIPPNLLLGTETNRAGGICVDMTGGTEGSDEIYGRLLEKGVGTVVAMHVSESHYKKAKEAKINLVIAGHIASDNLGMNLLLDKIFVRDSVEIIAGSGFRRVHRNKR